MLPGQWVEGRGLFTIATGLNRNLAIPKRDEAQKACVKIVLTEPHQQRPLVGVKSV